MDQLIICMRLSNRVYLKSILQIISLIHLNSERFVQIVLNYLKLNELGRKERVHSCYNETILMVRNIFFVPFFGAKIQWECMLAIRNFEDLQRIPVNATESKSRKFRERDRAQLITRIMPDFRLNLIFAFFSFPFVSTEEEREVMSCYLLYAKNVKWVETREKW